MTALMLPLMTHGMWWLLALGVGLLACSLCWENHLQRRCKGTRLLNPRLLSRIPGFGTGMAIGLSYFIGFSGIWVVLALYFQTGHGYTALSSGLAVTPFALGMSGAAALGGRYLARLGRWLTILGLGGSAIGLLGAGWVLKLAASPCAALTAAPMLLVAGIGSGLVIALNMTLTLAQVPLSMAGAASAALQTMQRVGSAVGTTLLAGIYYMNPRVPETALLDALLCAVIFVLLALAVALIELHRTTTVPVDAEA